MAKLGDLDHAAARAAVDVLVIQRHDKTLFLALGLAVGRISEHIHADCQRIGDVLVALKKRGMTILLVEQNFRFAKKVADRFYLMEDGRMVNSFPGHELDARMDELHEVLGV